MGAARADFMGKKYDQAESRYDRIAAEFPSQAPEALYWRAVSRYSATHDARAADAGRHGTARAVPRLALGREGGRVGGGRLGLGGGKVPPWRPYYLSEDRALPDPRQECRGPIRNVGPPGTGMSGLLGQSVRVEALAFAD